jgi:hypothetical protein
MSLQHVISQTKVPSRNSPTSPASAYHNQIEGGQNNGIVQAVKENKVRHLVANNMWATYRSEMVRSAVFLCSVTTLYYQHVTVLVTVGQWLGNH